MEETVKIEYKKNIRLKKNIYVFLIFFQLKKHIQYLQLPVGICEFVISIRSNRSKNGINDNLGIILIIMVYCRYIKYIYIYINA